jgi:UDP-N-acetylglucosamine--N-acetylmuramyl-(pentapeptide) pyrophosphoryl-undecaprenol N-acetylglucosamine transferase
VVTAFQHAQGYFPAGKAVLLGNPIRAEVAAALLANKSAQEKAAMGEPPCLLVLGGSQGARPVNELVCAALPRLIREVPGLRVIHQTGPADQERVAARYEELGVEARVEAFIRDMVTAYEPAWLMVGRSGASTVSELTLAGLPALLIPYPFAADDHQAKNAEEVDKAGGARVLRQAELTPETLADQLATLLSDVGRLGPMTQAMRAVARPNAADDAARLVEDLA